MDPTMKPASTLAPTLSPSAPPSAAPTPASRSCAPAWVGPDPQPCGGALAERILDAFPSGTYALSALLRLLDIVETTSVPTAAVECRAQPRLLVNPQFVDAHAQTPEKLLMLVMHELHHVLLGHTTLFPRITAAQNFVFDAVINAIVCRMFPGQDHIAFFTDYYDHASFPQCLLRPPPRWPKSGEGYSSRLTTAAGILALAPAQCALARELHESLYSSTGASYQEVFDALPKLLEGADLGAIPLMGGHQADTPHASGPGNVPDGELEHRSPVLFDIVRGLVEQWPQPPEPIRGRSLADVIRPTAVQPKRQPSNRETLRRLIRKVAGFKTAGAVRRMRLDSTQAPTPIPGLQRRSMVMRALGHTPLLHTGPAPWRRRVDSGERVHVYLDVSGSMNAVKAPLYGAVLDCAQWVHPKVHLFSTKVVDVSLSELRAGVCRSTGGTSIECVAAHMAAKRVRRALLITDGYVGKAYGQHKRTLGEVQLAVAFLGSNVTHHDLSELANHTAHLLLGDLS